MPKVLISDKLSQAAVDIFKRRGIDVDFRVGLPKDELVGIVGRYDGLVIRSATKVTGEILGAAGNLKVIGRAGIGVDNIDMATATAKGIVVMNTPFGNSITTAEHAIAMLLALARQIPSADISTQGGKWEKSRFMGVEVTSKTLGVIGCGNIGSIVAERAKGLHMRVMAYDPFLSSERADQLGVEKVELDDLLSRADFISLHTPLTDQTRKILSADSINKTKRGVRIVNCARGGLIDEAALKAALESGHVAGAALDVFEEEPAKGNILFGTQNLIATPHLGAATKEAQENVALQVAEQVSDFLLTGAVTNALNMPSLSADEVQHLKPYVRLAEQLGLFAGQLTESGITGAEIEYEGTVATRNIKPLTAAALAGLLKPLVSEVNMVNASVVAKERGIHVSETTRAAQGVFESYMRLTLTTERQTRSVAGTVFSDGQPRIIQVKGINMEASLSPHMLYISNEDRPGFIGALGTVLGDEGLNIATFNLGRAEQGGDAIALVAVDQPVNSSVLEKVCDLPHVVQAKALTF